MVQAADDGDDDANLAAWALGDASLAAALKEQKRIGATPDRSAVIALPEQAWS